jgi:hypothetical protein
MPQNIQSIPKEKFYNNQLLTVEDFNRERDFHIAQRELQTSLLYTPGIVAGLTVEAGPNQSQLTVASGVAIDGSGQQIILVDSAKFEGATVPVPSGSLVIDLNKPSYYVVGQDKSWLLIVAFNEELVPGTRNQLTQVPLFQLIDATTAQPGDSAQIPLAKLTVHATQQPPVAPAKAGTVTVQVQLDTSVRVNLGINASRISDLGADKITSGTLSADRLPDLPASKIKGQLKPDQIPPLPPSPILDWVAQLQKAISVDSASNVGIGASPSDAKLEVSGTLRATQVEGAGAGLTNLKAANIEGSLLPAQIPLLSLAQIPELPASKITGLLQTVWAQDVAIYAQGLKLVGSPQASSDGGFIVGLLKTETNQGHTFYALGIGFEHRLFTFTSQELAAGSLKMNVYPERTRYNLANEGGAKDEAATSVRFVGVDNDYAFDLLQSESQIPAASKGKVRSLVTVGTMALDASDIQSQIAANIINGFRDAVSPFSFVALANPAAPPSLTPEETARQLSSAGMIAPDAAAIIVAQQPEVYINQTGQFIQLMAAQFQASTQSPAQMAWTLGAAGIPVAQANSALGVYYRGKIKPREFLNMTLGAFPVPDVQKVVVTMQGQGKSAQDAALPLKQANAQYDKFPMQLGILLRLEFGDSADTPQKVAQALKNAGYTSKPDVQAALALLFPNTKAEDISAAVNQFWNS